MVNLLALESQMIIMVVLLVVMVVVLIVLPMFTNRRRNKAINDLHSSLRPGDVIKTVGGIVGKIIEIKEISPVDKEMVVETGVDDSKCTMVFDIQAVYQILSKTPEPIDDTAVVANTESSEQEPVAESEQESVSESNVEQAAESLIEKTQTEETENK